jgi:DNA-binding response OmpR family regulator
MVAPQVLIVEDEFLIALDVEQALIDAGFDVCGIATSEEEALAQAEAFHPTFAIVDINLSPGDGRVVAKILHERHNTLVLFATSQCRDVKSLLRTRAVACLPKPYHARQIPLALNAVFELSKGRRPEHLPESMFALA